MFVASLTFDSSMSAILARLVFLATVTSTLAIAERPTTRETTTDRTIQKTQALIVNPNIEIYTVGPPFGSAAAASNSGP